MYSRIFRDFCANFPFLKRGSCKTRKTDATTYTLRNLQVWICTKSRRLHFHNPGGAFARRTLWMRSARSSMQPAVLSEHTTLCTSQSEATAKQMETKLEHVGYIPAIWSLTVIYFDFRCVLPYVRLAVPIPPELPLQFSPTLTISC